MTEPSDLPTLGSREHAHVGTRFLFKPTDKDGVNVRPMELIALPVEATRNGCRTCIAQDPRRSREAGTDINCHSLPICGGIGAFAPATPENVAKVVAYILEKGTRR